MIKRVLFVLLGWAIVAGALAFVKVQQIQAAIEAGASMAPPPPSVATAIAMEEEWPRSLFAVGTVDAVQGVMLAAQLDGPVTEIHFRSGSQVEAGQVLATQDTSTDAAQLRSAQARARLAELQLQRNRDLRGSNSISQADLDAAEAEAASAAADVEALRATMAKKTIVAPFAGKLGIRQINLGQYLRAGDPIAALESLDPVYVNFSMPQQELAELRAGQAVALEVDTFPGEHFRGTISAISPRIDPQTRSLLLQAELPNPDGRLVPGMFARVNVELPDPKNYVTLPVTAVSTATYGSFVYVVEKDGGRDVVRQVPVRTAGRRGNQVAISQGIEPGTQVVVAGQMKLRDKSPVRINNDIEIPGDANPQVAER